MNEFLQGMGVALSVALLSCVATSIIFHVWHSRYQHDVMRRLAQAERERAKVRAYNENVAIFKVESEAEKAVTHMTREEYLAWRGHEKPPIEGELVPATPNDSSERSCHVARLERF